MFAATTTGIVPNETHKYTHKMPRRPIAQTSSSYPQYLISAMEPISLGVSIIVPLFQAAITCFTCVRIAKSFGSNLQTYTLRLEVLHLRLSRWGKVVGLTEKVDDIRNLKTKVLESQDIKIAESLLKQIERLFETVGKTSPEPKDTTESDLNHHDNLLDRMRNISIHRHRDSAITKKAKWYLYARNEMASLIDNLDKLISGLCDLFPSDADTTSQLCDEEASQLLDQDSLDPELLTLLQKAAAQVDIKLAEGN
jgi:hypothetical protein